MDIRSRSVHVFKKGTDSYQSLNSSNYMEDIKSCLALARGTKAYDKSLDQYPLDMWKQLLVEKQMALVMVEETDSKCQPRTVGFCFAFFVHHLFTRK